MAERPSELNKGTEIKVSKTDAIDTTNDSFDNTSLENRSTENSLNDDETFDTTDDVTSFDE